MISIQEWRKGVKSKRLCVDCGIDHPIKLPCTRAEGKTRQQCPDCFDTYTQWVTKEIKTIEEVRHIYMRRLLKNVDIKRMA